METISFDRLPVAVAQIREQLNRIESLLKKPEEPEMSRRFNFDGVLAYINNSGYAFSKSQLQKNAASGKIPCRKFNNRLVFDQYEIDDWIESQTVAVRQSDAASTLAKSAIRKLKRR